MQGLLGGRKLRDTPKDVNSEAGFHNSHFKIQGNNRFLISKQIHCSTVFSLAHVHHNISILFLQKNTSSFFFCRIRYRNKTQEDKAVKQIM